MVYVCCVQSCKYPYSQESDRIFHRLPLDNKLLLDAWLNAMGYDETFVPTQNSIICNIHFENDDYVLENGTYEINQSAVPSKFLKHKNSNTEFPNNCGVKNDELNNFEESSYNDMGQQYTTYIKEEIVDDAKEQEVNFDHQKDLDEEENLNSLDDFNKLEVNLNENTTPIKIVNIQGNFSNNLNNENFNSNKIISGSNNCIKEGTIDIINVSDKNIDNTMTNNITNESTSNQNFQFRNNTNSSNTENSMTNVKTIQNVIICQKNNPGISNLTYLSNTNNKNKNELSSGVHLFKIVSNNNSNANSTSVSRYVTLNSVNKSTSINNAHLTKIIIPKTTNVFENIEANQWISNQSQTQFKYNLPIKFFKKIKLLSRQNRRLISKIKSLTTRKQDLLTNQIMYLQLKNKVLEMEEKLLLQGINTSDYPAFRLVKNQDDHTSKILNEHPKNIEYDVLLESQLDNHQISGNNKSKP